MLRFLITLGLFGWTLATGVAAERPPNIVLIVADDLGAHDLGVTGSLYHETPRLDRLAREGMRFNDAYSACTVCSPSRAAILTGRHPARLHLTDWISGHAAPLAKLKPPVWSPALKSTEVTIAHRLAQAGYQTLHLGKWHLGGPDSDPMSLGFHQNLGGDHRGQPPSYHSPYGLPNLPNGPVGEYLTDREGEEAVRFITASRDQPFFLNWWPYAVHSPLQAPTNLINYFRQRPIPQGSTQSNAVYAAMLQSLDSAVGRVLDVLSQYGLQDNTLVIFTSDNGGLILGNSPATSNAPLRSGKGSPYEGGHRVPLLVRWTGVVPPNTISSVPVSGLDLHPTLAEIAGLNAAPPNTAIDGLSLVPLWKNQSLPERPLTWHYPHYHPGGATPYAAIRTGPWKLIQYYEDGRHELYDLSDEGENPDANLAHSHPDQVLMLSRQLFEWQNRVGAQWPQPNPQWQSTPLVAPENEPIALHSRHAFVHGDMLRYEPQPFKNTLGWWTRPSEWVHWDFILPHPGRFTIDVVQGCGNGSGGSIVDVTLGSQSWEFTVIETGGFQEFVRRTIGETQLPAGRHTLAVRPRTKPGPAVMDLREVTLRPITVAP